MLCRRIVQGLLTSQSWAPQLFCTQPKVTKIKVQGKLGKEGVKVCE